MSPIGVLLMAYGGPNSLDEVPGYLADIRAGRTTPRVILEEIVHNYAAIGGRSPLLEISQRQAHAVAQLLAQRPEPYRVYLGMRHWSPWIEDTLRQMLDEGIERSVALVLAPHYSSMSIARYQARLQRGLEFYHGSIEFSFVKSYHDHPKLIRALAERVRMGLERLGPDAHVILSAHSLPARLIEEGDPYPEQLLTTARLVAAEAGLPEGAWSWSYQSAGRTAEPWLGPAYEDHLTELARRGVRKVVAVPVGFVADHVEILFDLDLKARGLAEELGLEFFRPPALNEDPLFMEALAEVIVTHTPWKA
jgi:ferrochelatase